MEKLNLKHTKEKWAWQKFGEHPLLTAQHGMREIIIGSIDLNEDHNNEFPARPIPAMNNDGLLQPINPKNPNAMLIVSAPEMLKTLLISYLKLQVSTLKNMSVGVSVDSVKVGLRNAISDATGIGNEELQAFIENLAYTIKEEKISINDAIICLE